MEDSPTTLYRFFGDRRVLLYVGVGGNPGRRFNQHAKDKLWWPNVVTTTMEHFGTRQEALDAETAAIRSEFPLYNVVHNKNREEQNVQKEWREFTQSIATNWDLQGFDFRLLLFFWGGELSTEKWEVLNHGRIARQMSTDQHTISRPRVSKALKTLTEAGLILEGDESRSG